ncbi:BatD family protein [bacterium]
MKKILLGILLILNCSFLFAQDISISASVDKNTVTQDGQIILQISVSGSARNLPTPSVPQINGFTVYSSGRSQNISIVNGQMQSSLVYNYVLSPQSIGQYTIPAISITHQSKTFSTTPINVQVVKTPSSHTQITNQQTQTTPGQLPQTQQVKDVFITLQTNKKTAYVNEPITLTFRFYTRINLTSGPQYSPPDISGFWAEDLPPQKTYMTNINGVRYRVTEVTTQLFATTSGKQTIGHASLTVSVPDSSSRSRDSFFDDDFFGRFFSSGKPVTLKTNPIKLNILPLPSKGKPASFNGAVGQYKMSTSVDRKNISVGDALTYTLTIRGSGNIKSVTEPSLLDTANFKKYDSISSENISKQNYKVSGSKTFKITLVPKVSGILNLPQASFSFFDHKKKKYIELKSAPIKLNIKHRSKQKTDELESIYLPEQVKQIAKDIRFIEEKTKLKSGSTLLLNNRKFWLFVILFPLLYLLVLLRRFYRYTISKDPISYKKRKALREALADINKSKKVLNKDEKEAVQILSNTITNYFAKKLNLEFAGLTIRKVQNDLEIKNIDKYLIDELIKQWNRLDFMRYAPSTIKKEDVKNLTKKLHNTLSQLDKYIQVNT